MVELDLTDEIRNLEDLLPLAKERLKDPLIAEPFYKDFTYSFCWSSNAIEGNTLSLEETISLIEYDEVSAGHTYSEYTDAKNLYSAIKMYLSFSEQKVSEEWIKDIAHEITGFDSGYRKENIYIGSMIEAVYYPPDHKDVSGLMKEYIEGIDSKKELSLEDKVKDLAEKHIRFERIHPFKDGNGRTGRIILNQSLINEGLLPVVIETKSKYRNAFKEFNKSGDTSFMENILLKGMLSAVEKIDTLYINQQRSKTVAIGKSHRIEDDFEL